MLSGGSGDMDLYVKFGSIPSESQSDSSSMGSNNDESITIQSPKIGKCERVASLFFMNWFMWEYD